MAKSKAKPRKAAKAPKFSPMRAAALAGVSRAAFLSGAADQDVTDKVKEACGSKPTLTLYKHCRNAFIIARMAGSLPAQSDETMEQRIARADMLLNRYQGFGGKAKLRDGMLGRRTKAQENAYGAARNRWTDVCSKAGVKVPETRGSDTSKTRRAPQPGKKAAANSNKPLTVAALSPKLKTGDDAVRHIQTQAKALAAFIAKNAALDIPAEYGRAVTAFHKAIFKSVND